MRELMMPAETMGVDDAVSKAISSIGRSKTHGVVVLIGCELFGVVDDRCLRDFAGDAAQAKLAGVAVKTPTARNSTTPEELVAMFLDTQARIIPFLEGGRVAGVFARPQVMRFVAEASLAKSSKVGDFASRHAMIGEEATISDARRAMRDLSAHHLAVVSGNGSLAGVVSSFDVCTRVLPHLRQKPDGRASEPSILEQKVTAITKPVPQTARWDEPLSDACRRMADNNVSALVVVDAGNRPVGLLSVNDAINCVLKPSDERVMVYGLRDDEKSLAQSIIGMGSVFLEKASKKSKSDYLMLHVKSVQEGAKRRYLVQGRLIVEGRVHSASTREGGRHKEAWDLRLAVKEVLDELGRIVSDKEHGKPRAIKKRAGEEKRLARDAG